MKRKLLVALAAVVAVLVIGVGVLWFLKPWVPDLELVQPGSTGRRVVENGIFANYFPGPRDEGPAVLLLGGSEGGIGSSLTEQALSLQEAGFGVLTPSYFGAPGQRGNLELIPLETFDRALEWLRSQPEVDPDRIAVAGHSKGSEAALLTGGRHKDLKAVVASAPSSVVWPGIDYSGFDPASSWSSEGRPLPHVPYAGLALFGDIGRVYREALKNIPDHPDAAIAVERISSPVLLVCGEADGLWPACPMARQLEKRAEERDGPSVRILAYDDAGHRLFGPKVPRDDPRLEQLSRWEGGSGDANNDARADAWPKVIAFLRARLR